MKPLSIHIILYLISLSCFAQELNDASLSSEQSVTPLEQILNPDGSIRLNSEFNGALRVEGWQMYTGPNGKPGFHRNRENALMVPEDSLWDGRFGPKPAIP